MQILKAVGDELQNDHAFQPHILGPLEVAGIESLGETNVVIRSRMKTVPLKQFDVARELRRRIKIAFERRGSRFNSRSAKSSSSDRRCGAVDPVGRETA